MKADICVIGGGASGCMAALAAARKGASVVLLERDDTLGGTARDAMHPYLCGFFANDAARPFTFLNDGIAEEFVRAWIEHAPSDPRVRMGRVELLAIDPSVFWPMIVDAVAAQKNVTLLTGHSFVDADCCDAHIRSVSVSKDGIRTTIEARAFVDATGDALLAQSLAAAQFDEPDAVQQSAVCMSLKGITSWSPEDALSFAYAVRKAAEAGEIPRSSRHANAMFERYTERLIVKYSALAYDRTVADELTRIVSSMSPGKDVAVERLASRILQRSGPRGRGLYTITAGDVRNGAVFSDAVARAAWPLEF